MVIRTAVLVAGVAAASAALVRFGAASLALAPPVLDWLARIATRFSVQVSQELVVKAIPFVSAAGGAAINALFVQHFQDVARAHFTIRRLERRYGVGTVHGWYTELKWLTRGEAEHGKIAS